MKARTFEMHNIFVVAQVPTSTSWQRLVVITDKAKQSMDQI